MAKPAKAKQPDLPGMEQREIEAIVQAAERYRETRDERMRLSKLEGEQKQDLIAIMRKFDKHTYNYRGLFITLTEEIGVKVRAKDDEQVEAEASTRNTRVEIDELKAAAAKTPKPEPTPDESQANVIGFLGKEKAAAANGKAAGESDEWTAQKCEECGGIDGAHSVNCSHSNGLTMADYLAYAKAKGVKQGASWARKWQLTREKDGLVLAWKAEGAQEATKRVANKPAPKAAAAKAGRRRARL